MRRQLLLLLMFLFAIPTLHAQIKIKGAVKDKVSQEALQGVQITLKGTSILAASDSDGKFELNDVPSGTFTLNLKFENYEDFNKRLKVEDSNIDLGIIFMNLSILNTGNDVIIELSNEELEGSDEDMHTNISGILHGSNDVFLNTAGFTFGPLRYRLRGYDNKYSNLHMNGIQTNDLESGRAIWGYWGGLNDAVRNKVTGKGIAETDYSFGGIGGSTDINTRASHIRVGTKLTYSFTNRSYDHRAMFIHNTGMMENGWALAVSGSRRYAEEGFAEGTSYDAYAYFASIEKKFNDKHSLGLVGFGAPSKRGGGSATTDEVYDMTGTRYNPNWGWQDGAKRNARITDGHTPYIILTHYWDIDNSSKIQTSLAYSKGKYNRTSLNWFEAADPRPDYYRYLPSYMETDEAKLLRTEEFENGERQLDWDAMYQTNYTSFEEITDADGINGNTVSGNRSQYIIENRRNENNQFWFNTVYKKLINENFKLSAGIQHRYYKARHYKTLEDLLGGDFFVDIDKYANRDLSGEGVEHNDISIPNHIIDEQDEIFGNDYYATVNYSELWANANYNINKFDFYLTGKGSYTYYWRTGNMQNGKYPESSFGDSEKLSFIDYGIKGGLTYKISGKHFLHGSAVYLTKAPDFRNAFVSPRTRNQIVDGLSSETIYSGEAGYTIQSSKIKATFDLFYTQFKNQSEVRSYYIDDQSDLTVAESVGGFYNIITTNINKTHQGIEAGIEYNAFPGLTIFGVGSLGFYRWSDRPVIDLLAEASAVPVLENDTAYVKGFLVGGTPQTAFSAGVKYFGSKYWWIGVSANYFDHRYIDVALSRRVVDVLALADHSTHEFLTYIGQEKFPSVYTLDAFAGKSFRFNYKYYLNISLNVTNLLNNQSIKTGGYEQARVDLQDYNKFANKYYYYSGIQYYLNISFRF